MGLYLNKATPGTIMGLYLNKAIPCTRSGLYMNKATPDTVNHGPVSKHGNTMHTVSHLAAPNTQSITGLLLNKATPETQTIIQFTSVSLLPYDESWKKCTWNCLFPFLR